MNPSPAAVLARLGWLDILEESPPLLGDTRFLREFFLPARGRYRRREFRAVLEKMKGRALRAPEDLATRGRLERILGEGGAAELDLGRALRRGPRCAAALAFQGEASCVHDPEDACRKLAEALVQDGGNPHYQAWLGYAHFLAGRTGPSLAALNTALRPGSACRAGRLLRGIILERSPQGWGDAERDYCAAARAAPRCPGIYTLRGGVRCKAGNLSAALRDAHQGITLHPENFDTFVRILYLSVRRNAAADPRAERQILLESAARLSRRDPSQAWAHAARAVILGTSELQVAPLRRSVELDPKRAWVRAFLGRALSGDSGTGAVRSEDLKAGLAQMSAAIRLSPRIGWMRSWRAEILKKLDRKEEALRELDRGIALDPDYRLAHAWRSSLREELGDKRGALEDMSRCLEALDRSSFRHRRAVLERGLSPDSIRPLDDLARLSARGSRYALAYGGFNEDLPASERAYPEGFLSLTPENLMPALRRNPKEPLAQAWIGRAYLTAGARGRARPFLEKALALDAGCWAALAWRGEARARAGDWGPAERDLASCLRLMPEHLPALMWRAAVSFARGYRQAASEDLLEACRRDPPGAGAWRSWAREVFARLGKTTVDN